MRHRGRFLPLFLIPLALAEASAQGKAPQAQEKNPYVERFNQLDRNGDGYVSLDEWPLEPASFHRVDRNRDGRLSPSELLTPNVPRRDPWQERFQELDTNGDGCVTWTEWQRGGIGIEPRDRDDGSTTRRERGDETLSGENTWDTRATLQDQLRFRSLDLDRDNRLSRLEWTGSSAEFDRLDRNRDGVLSPSEWPR